MGFGQSPQPAGVFTTTTTVGRDAFVTGSVRGDRTGKGRYDLLPREAIHRLAQLYERGADNYGDRNWEKGQPLSRVVDSLLRHAFQLAAGLDDEDHAAAVMWNAAAVIAISERIKSGELPAELDELNSHPSRPTCDPVPVPGGWSRVGRFLSSRRIPPDVLCLD